MPISIPPLSRRRFLKGSLAAGAGLLLRQAPWAFAADKAVDPHRFALLSDVHINADPAFKERDQLMFDNLKHVLDEVLQLDTRPAWLSINGDCAYRFGLAKDYATLLGLLKPVREAGLPIHVTVGNHDKRDNFWEAFPRGEIKRPVEDRQALVLEAERANWFILDSLDKTNQTPGILGEKQLAWLAGALDAKPDKPALVMVHHNPQDQAISKVKGIIDTPAFLDVILPRKHVKALLYGHTHTWRIDQREGMHLINFPATGYPFKPEEPIGWVDCHLAQDGMALQLHCIDPKHPSQGERHALKWRT